MLSRPYFAPLVGLAVMLSMGISGEYAFVLEKQRVEQDQRSRVVREVGQYRAALEGELNSTLYLANGLVAYIETHQQLEPDIAQSMLRTLHAQGHQLRNIGLAPGNRLTYIYPETGNQKVIGLYYPDVPDQWPAVHQAIVERRAILAGPVKLKQGGVGLVYRVPVFVGPEKRYWGLLSMVIDTERLFRRVGIAPQVDQLQLALRGKDGKGAAGEIFMGDAALFSAGAVTASISTPGGTWQIAAKPVDGWISGTGIGWLRAGFWGAGILLGIALYYALSSLRRRILAEQALQNSHDELNEAQRIAMIGSWVLDLRTQHLSWSPEIFRIFEIDPEKFKASYEAFLKTVHPEDREMVDRTYIESVANRTPYDIDHRLLFDDGRIKYVRERCETLYAKDGNPVLSRGTVQDVTKLRVAEEALRLSEERWKFALEGAGDGVWDWNLQTGELYLSKQEMTVLGYDGEAATHSNIEAWVPRQHPDDIPVRKSAIQQYLSGEAPVYTCEFRTRGKDDSWRWILARGMLVSRTSDGKPLRMIGTHTDITKRKRVEAEVKRLSQWNELLLNSAGDGIYGVDLEGKCTFINPAAIAMLGFEKDEVLGKIGHDLFHHHRADGSVYHLENCPILLTLNDGIPRKTEEMFFRKGGAMFPVQMTSTPVHDGREIIGVVVIFQDITDRKTMENELISLATTDTLTGMANRRKFLEQLTMEVSRTGRFGRSSVLLMVDIDHFKVINDTYGHAVGDAVLQHFAEITQKHLRHIDLLGRLGGEEFGILLPETNTAGALAFAERYQRHIAETPTQSDKGAVPFTISIGLTEIYPSDADPDSVMARADEALYRAKAGGRNRVETSSEVPSSI